MSAVDGFEPAAAFTAKIDQIEVMGRIPARCGRKGDVTGSGAAELELKPGLRAWPDGVRALAPCAEHLRQLDVGVPDRRASRTTDSSQRQSRCPKGPGICRKAGM
jgi:hypothetical protein